MKILIALTLSFALALSLVACNSSSEAKSSPYTSAVVGGIIQLGGYDWRELDVKDSKALILSDQILIKKGFHVPHTPVTWEECSLREYLNEEFYDSTFTAEEKTWISESRIVNNDNPWFDVAGGNNTTDKVFLLSAEEVSQYFGDSGQLINDRPDEETLEISKKSTYVQSIISDEYNGARIAEYKDTGAWWWWLRSPGRDNRDNGSSQIVRVITNGTIDLNGIYPFEAPWGYDYHGGVRPALWLKI